MAVPYRHMPKPAHRGPLRSFVFAGMATFLLGGVIWLYTDLRAFDPITPLTVIGSVILWATFGWMPSLAMGALQTGLEVLVGRHRDIHRRNGAILTAASLALMVIWCAGMEISVSVGDVQIDPGLYAKKIRQAGDVIEPGEVGSYVSDYQAPRSQYVAFKTLEARRDELRQGGRWALSDLEAIDVAARENLDSNHTGLRELSRETLIWARLERMEPGVVAKLMADDAITEREVAEWLVDWERPGRPRIETAMNEADHAAVQTWAADNLPDGRRALEWSMDQVGAGAVETVFTMPLEPATIDALLRGWCTTEGWSPLGRDAPLTAGDRSALGATLDRLEAAEDPMVRRQTEGYRKWLDAHMPPVRR